jgi:pyrroline-5-carboxylate reductase
MNIGIIGFGKMGEAIAKGLLKARGYRVFYNEIKKERIEEVSKKYPQVKHLSLEQLIDVSEAIILSVKHQDLDELLNKVDQILKR